MTDRSKAAADAGSVAIRPMRPADLGAVDVINEAAFGGILAELYRVRPPRVFAPEMFAERLDRDPGGCFVAEDGTGRIAGSIFSVHWGSLGWLGPVAVDPARQNQASGQALVRACLDYWDRLGVRVGGLETFPQSAKHLHVYAKLGFAPLGLTLALDKLIGPSAVQGPGSIARWSALSPAEQADLRAAADQVSDRFCPGLRLGSELGGAANRRETMLLRRGPDLIGFAVCHTVPLLRPGRAAIDVPLAAIDPATGGPADLIALFGAVEDLGRETGARGVATRLYGHYLPAYQALASAGYRIIGSSVRMKRGPDAVYDRPEFLLLDNWL